VASYHCMIITEQVVERAHFSKSVKKAPGTDRQSLGVIRLLGRSNRTSMAGLTKLAVRTGDHTAVWMHASGVVIQKPGKKNYTKLKSYGIISLLSCMG